MASEGEAGAGISEGKAGGSTLKTTSTAAMQQNKTMKDFIFIDF